MNFINLKFGEHTVAHIFNALAILILVSCSSTTVISVKSDPVGADVYIKNMGSDAKEKIGVTPLVLEGEKFEALKLKDGPLVVVVEKDGHSKEQVLLSDTNSVDIELSLKLTASDKLENAKQMDDISGKLFEVQRFIRTKNYPEALKLTTQLKDLYPEISVANELEGSIYYLQKDYKKSLEAFNQAYSKNTENTFALKMKKVLEKKIKGN